MEEKEIIRLIERFLSDDATAAERKQLDDWYSKNNGQEVVWVAETAEEEAAVNRRMLRKLKKHVVSSRSPLVSLYRYWMPRAAVVTGAVLISSYLFFKPFPSAKPEADYVSVSAPAKARENKYVVLPDSSTIVLHSGSTVSYAFNGKLRQVNLSGEAYFDIRHEQHRPFVIHTGKVSTTVLGTAFNIKAYPHQGVTVSVTRGRVSVADQYKKTIAILTPDHQVVYNEHTKVSVQHEVKAQGAVSWAKADMQFTDLPFKILAERLSRRYNVEVKFKNEELEKCLITGRFNGTESLGQVLQVLAETMATTYAVNGQIVTLDGKSCQ